MNGRVGVERHMNATKCFTILYKSAASCLTKRQFFIITALVHSRPSIQVNIKTNIVFYFKGTVLFTLLYLIYLR